MIEIGYIIIGALILIIVFLLLKRRKKYSLPQFKSLIVKSDQDIMEAHKQLKKAHTKMNELYKAILSIESGFVKGGNN